MVKSDNWWTYPADSDSGRTIIVTGRDGIDSYINSGKYVYRIDVTWKYDSRADGMPADEDARLMEAVTDSLLTSFKKDKVAVMTGIYTGDGARDWVFYTKNLKIFNLVFNKALEQFEVLPLVIEASSDPDWEEYKEMREQTYIPDED